MLRRIIAIAFIFACTSVAWVALAGTLYERTRSSDRHLRERVSSNWGTPQAQQAPLAYTHRFETRAVAAPEVANPRTPDRTTATTSPERTEIVTVQTPLQLNRTRAAADLSLQHRRKGLMWYSTYTIAFDGAFLFSNTTASDSVVLEFPLPAAQAVYDDLTVTLNGAAAEYQIRGQSVVATARVPHGDTVTLGVAYKSQGLDEWRYALGNAVTNARDFELTMHTDFDAIDFPDNTLSPTEKRAADGGWELVWKYNNLLSGFHIGMDLPDRLQPGPVASQIALFAPVSLLFFFAVVFIIVTIRGVDLHPMNYAFLAAAFFAFHLLLAYLVDHISMHLAFAIASVVSIALVVSYLRLAVGWQFAVREAAIAQFLYLVLFSYAFFFKGFTGLTITIGSILTLFVAMQLTGRVNWSELFASEAGRLRTRTP